MWDMQSMIQQQHFNLSSISFYYHRCGAQQTGTLLGSDWVSSIKLAPARCNENCAVTVTMCRSKPGGSHYGSAISYGPIDINMPWFNAIVSGLRDSAITQFN